MNLESYFLLYDAERGEGAKKVIIEASFLLFFLNDGSYFRYRQQSMQLVG
jgi:hypothetical protein